jgi:hypothetical protein
LLEAKGVGVWGVYCVFSIQLASLVLKVHEEDLLGAWRACWRSMVEHKVMIKTMWWKPESETSLLETSMKAIFVYVIKSLLHNGINGVGKG